MLEVLKHRHGVCQDFAHLMIGCLRSLGLPARYVSGYLVTRPPPGKPRLVGCDASHAWVSAFFPDFGWVDFDPTNGCLPSHEHITVGWARDYDDISPVKGVIVGGSGHALSVSVDVEPLTPSARTAVDDGLSRAGTRGRDLTVGIAIRESARTACRPTIARTVPRRVEVS